MALKLLKCCLLSALIIPVLGDQQILGFDAGLLRRFTTNGTDDVEEILRHSQEHDLDVWHVSPTHVDIYSPSASTPLPISLQSLSHTTQTIPRSPISSKNHVPEPWNLTSLTNSTFHSAYHPLFEVDQFIHEVAALYPSRARTVHLGHSGLGREMLGLEISSGTLSTASRGDVSPRLDPQEKLGFVIVGAIHAREWIATAASLYLAHALVANGSEPQSLSYLLDAYDFYIIPAPNPDGYDYTWESDRYWYKNRQPMGPKAKCVGLDMNRNWGYKWKPDALGMKLQENNSSSFSAKTSSAEGPSAKKPQAPTDPCSHWYPGHRAFESPEVNNIANYITTLSNVVAFVDLRSYGQMLSAPYSYKCKRVAKDAEDQIEAAMGAAHALKAVHGTSFTTGSLCELLYRAPGNMVDWMYARAGIKYSYAAHLRDTGTYGFSLPPEWIRPVGEETGSMVEYLAKFIAKQLNSM